MKTLIGFCGIPCWILAPPGFFRSGHIQVYPFFVCVFNRPVVRVPELCIFVCNTACCWQIASFPPPLPPFFFPSAEAVFMRCAILACPINSPTQCGRSKQHRGAFFSLAWLRAECAEIDDVKTIHLVLPVRFNVESKTLTTCKEEASRMRLLQPMLLPEGLKIV